MRYRLSALLLATLFAGSTARAMAQDSSVLVQPALPDDFDKGRNISVLQRARPEYDATGVRVGSFNFYPQLDVALGYSNNLYHSKTDKQDGAYAIVAPSFRLESDWSRHLIKLQGDVQAERYFGESQRNQTPFNFGADHTGVPDRAAVRGRLLRRVRC
jgi:hypothetical protein